MEVGHDESKLAGDTVTNGDSRVGLYNTEDLRTEMSGEESTYRISPAL
jgi:hypothetical protein